MESSDRKPHKSTTNWEMQVKAGLNPGRVNLTTHNLSASLHYQPYLLTTPYLNIDPFSEVFIYCEHVITQYHLASSQQSTNK